VLFIPEEMNALLLVCLFVPINFGNSESVFDQEMNQEANFALIRNVKRDRQEGHGTPIQGVYSWALLPCLRSSPWGAPFTVSVPGNDPQASTTLLSSTFCAVKPADGMLITSACTGLSSCNFPSSNITIQIERSYLAIVAKQEEFCCGPRQGN